MIIFKTIQFKKKQFLESVKLNKRNVIKTHLSRGQNINSKEQYGMTMMHHALLSENSDLSLIQFLVDNKADLMIKDNANTNCLHFALECKKPKLEIIQFLLEKKVDPKFDPAARISPLHMAAGNEKIDGKILDCLIQDLSDLNQGDTEMGKKI